jgi:hypothetical protein
MLARSILTLFGNAGNKRVTRAKGGGLVPTVVVVSANGAVFMDHAWREQLNY